MRLAARCGQVNWRQTSRSYEALQSDTETGDTSVHTSEGIQPVTALVSVRNSGRKGIVKHEQGKIQIMCFLYCNIVGKGKRNKVMYDYLFWW